MRVLIVEPDGKSFENLNRMVDDLGHEPVRAQSEESARELLKSGGAGLGLVLLATNGGTERTSDFLGFARGLDPSPPVIVVSAEPRFQEAVFMMKTGAHDFWVKPVEFEKLAKTVEWMENRVAGRSSGASDGEALKGVERPIITQNTAMIKLKGMVKKVAPTRATVFIQGESGTGKELIARYLHAHSNRTEGPFVALNCAALPENLLESELFGHEKGAFTGAVKAKPGRFELAEGGTLLLDEITEIPVHLQAKLLRVLQENEVDRVGGRRPVPVDVRVVATTNMQVEEALKEGQFRKDLYYRLNVIPVRLPPLRERSEDVVLLSRYFLEKYSRMHSCAVDGFTAEALALLRGHSWPGNVRELENVVQRAVLLAPGTEVTPECLMFDGEDPGAASSPTGVDLMPLGEMEKLMIHKALDSTDGNRTRAAEILGISVRTLRNKLNEYRQSAEH